MITIQEYTTKNPITMIGREAGICYGSDVSDDNKNYKRGLEMLASNHGRTLEFPDVYAVIDGYSARVIREWYTHLGGAPTRVQSSTRYIDYKNFEYIIPPTIDCNKDAHYAYVKCMKQIREALRELIEVEGISKEDAANLLPLGMTTSIVDKRNLRNLIDMSHARECVRAYWEYRELFNDYKKALSDYSPEWKYIVDNYFMPKCEWLGKCTEAHSCGRM